MIVFALLTDTGRAVQQPVRANAPAGIEARDLLMTLAMKLPISSVATPYTSAIAGGRPDRARRRLSRPHR